MATTNTEAILLGTLRTYRDKASGEVSNHIKEDASFVGYRNDAGNADEHCEVFWTPDLENVPVGDAVSRIKLTLSQVWSYPGFGSDSQSVQIIAEAVDLGEALDGADGVRDKPGVEVARAPWPEYNKPYASVVFDCDLSGVEFTDTFAIRLRPSIDSATAGDKDIWLFVSSTGLPPREALCEVEHAPSSAAVSDTEDTELSDLLAVLTERYKDDPELALVLMMLAQLVADSE